MKALKESILSGSIYKDLDEVVNISIPIPYPAWIHRKFHNNWDALDTINRTIQNGRDKLYLQKNSRSVLAARYLMNWLDQQKNTALGKFLSSPHPECEFYGNTWSNVAPNSNFNFLLTDLNDADANKIIRDLGRHIKGDGYEIGLVKLDYKFTEYQLLIYIKLTK